MKHVLAQRENCSESSLTLTLEMRLVSEESTSLAAAVHNCKVQVMKLEKKVDEKRLTEWRRYKN